MTALLLKNRPQLGRVIRVAKDLFNTNGPASVVVDEKTQETTWTISTPTIDYDGDVVVPKGCLEHLPRYQRNPVVLLEHDKASPVGVSLSPQTHNPGVWVGDEWIKATCRHQTETLVGRDVYRLVKAGVLRGASIGYLAAPGGVERLQKGRYLFTKWILNEWSITSLPTNFEALRDEFKSLESVEVRKAMQRHLPARPSWSRGVTIRKAAMSTIKQAEPAAVVLEKKAYTKRAALAWLKRKGFSRGTMHETAGQWVYGLSEAMWGERKSLAKGVIAVYAKAAVDDEDDDEKKKKKEDEAKDKDAPADPPADASASSDEETKDAPEEDAADESAEVPEAAAEDEADAAEELADDPATPKPGAVTLAEVLNHFAGACQYAEEKLAHNENPAVVAFLEELHAMCSEWGEKVTALAGEHYPDVDLGKATQVEGEDDLDEHGEKSNHRRLTKRLNKSGMACLKDAQEFLDDVATDQRVPKSLTAGCRHHAKALGDLHDGMGAKEGEGEGEAADTPAPESKEQTYKALAGLFKERRGVNAEAN
jgi:hypothetical protein